MAQLVEIGQPRSDSERDAQTALSRILPASWIITTNIKERNFPGRRKPEIDSIVISPSGVFILDFKHFSGHVTPMTNQAWSGLNDNPFEQADDNVYPVKTLIEAQVGQDVWIESFIVLTHKAVELDWKGSDVDAAPRSRVALVHEVEARISEVASKNRNKMSLSRDLARKVMDALKPGTLPAGLFEHPDWDAHSISAGNGMWKAGAATRSSDALSAEILRRQDGTGKEEGQNKDEQQAAWRVQEAIIKEKRQRALQETKVISEYYEKVRSIFKELNGGALLDRGRRRRIRVNDVPRDRRSHSNWLRTIRDYPEMLEEHATELTPLIRRTIDLISEVNEVIGNGTVQSEGGNTIDLEAMRFELESMQYDAIHLTSHFARMLARHYPNETRKGWRARNRIKVFVTKYAGSVREEEPEYLTVTAGVCLVLFALCGYGAYAVVRYIHPLDLAGLGVWLALFGIAVAGTCFFLWRLLKATALFFTRDL